MLNKLCLSCFRIKGEYKVCPYCGYIEGSRPKSVFFLKPGVILKNRYIIGGVIGYGGFGITYKAYDVVLSIVVAIKEFYPAGLVSRAEGNTKVSIFSGDKSEKFNEIKERFLEEARNMAMFSEEKDIVNVYTYFQDNGTAYIIMEYIEGILLKTYLENNGPIKEKEVYPYFYSLLSAVQKIHNKGIIHKDISADNIFLVSSAQIKILDFGAARFKNSESDKKLAIVVKNGYAPPEQYYSKGVIDYRTDIYAVGAVMYQMLTGEKPPESLERIKKDNICEMSKRGLKIHSGLEKAVMKALALKPEERYSSIEKFEEAVKDTEKKKNWKWW